MFRKLFGPNETTKLDVVFAIAAVAVAAYKAIETVNEYKKDAA